MCMCICVCECVFVCVYVYMCLFVCAKGRLDLCSVSRHQRGRGLGCSRSAVAGEAECMSACGDGTGCKILSTPASACVPYHVGKK